MFNWLKKIKARYAETELEYYEDGTTIKTAYEVDGIGRMIGACERFYKSGQLQERCQYRRNTPVGPFVRYYPNGQIRERGNYDRSGRLEGGYTRYHPNGQMMIKCHYHKDQKDGDYESYDMQGNLMRSCSYRAGKLEGDYLFYNSKGKMIKHFICCHAEENKDERDSPARQEICRLLNQVNKQMEPTRLRRAVRIGLINKYRDGYLRD